MDNQLVNELRVKIGEQIRSKLGDHKDAILNMIDKHGYKNYVGTLEDFKSNHILDYRVFVKSIQPELVSEKEDPSDKYSCKNVTFEAVPLYDFNNGEGVKEMPALKREYLIWGIVEEAEICISQTKPSEPMKFDFTKMQISESPTIQRSSDPLIIR